MIALTSYHSTNYLMTGVDPQRTGNLSVVGSPSGLFSAQDGDFFLSCATDGMFRILANDVVGRPELADDPDYVTNEARCDNGVALCAILSDIFARRGQSHWVDLLLARGIPAGRVRSVGEALDSEEATARGIVSRVVHPRAGPLPNIAPPLRLSGTPIVPPRPVPDLGQDSGEVLRDELGYDEARIAALAANGAFAGAVCPP